MIHSKSINNVEDIAKELKKFSEKFYKYIEKNWIGEKERWHRTARKNPYSIFNTNNNAESIIRALEVLFF